MQKTQLIKALSALSVALFLGGTGITNASAKSVKTKGFRVTKITKNTHYTKSPYTKKSPAKGVTLYSSRYLTKHTTSKKTKTFYSTQSVRVVKSTGKTATYRYVKNAKGSVKGWIWTGNLTGKQGKTTSVSNKTVIAPTTNVKTAKKTTVTTLKKTSNVKPAKTDKSKVYVITDAVSNKSYAGLKNVATFRDSLNKVAYILTNYPAAWDNAHYGAFHKDTYNFVFNNYMDAYRAYRDVKSLNTTDISYFQGVIEDNTKMLNDMIKDARY